MLLFIIALPFTCLLSDTLIFLSPDLLLFMIMGLMGLAQVGVMVVPDAIVASIADLEEKRSGQRREAMYFGTQGLLVKMAMGGSALVSGGWCSSSAPAWEFSSPGRWRHWWCSWGCWPLAASRKKKLWLDRGKLTWKASPA